MNYRALMRRKFLESMYDKMSDEEKRLYVQMSIQDRDHQEIMQALQSQHEKLDAISKKQNWAVDFGSDIAANFFTDGLIWLGSKLFRKL